MAPDPQGVLRYVKKGVECVFIRHGGIHAEFISCKGGACLPGHYRLTGCKNQNGAGRAWRFGAPGADAKKGGGREPPWAGAANCGFPPPRGCARSQILASTKGRGVRAAGAGSARRGGKLQRPKRRARPSGSPRGNSRRSLRGRNSRGGRAAKKPAAGAWRRQGGSHARG